jgi:ABC-type antimicrobial peptide transport system permease subunit
MDQISKVLRERHHIRHGETDGFSIRYMTQMMTALSSTTTMMTNLLLSLAMISLVVGGVGIMNTVLLSASVGMIYGFYPTWKASRMDPIVALRYE